MNSKRIALIALIVLIGVSGVIASVLLRNNQRSAFSNTENLLEWEAETLLDDPHLAQQFIRMGPPELKYNCHGWAFTQGQMSIADDEVANLLHHSFRKVTVPIAGDVVVYYDKDNNICHSGVIKATGRNGFVLVESKWGGAGRFLHLIDLPPVQVRHEYYRRSIGTRRPPGGALKSIRPGPRNDGVDDEGNRSFRPSRSTPSQQLPTILSTPLD